MSLLDTSPGGFIGVANCVLYGTVGVECWMLTTDSMLAMAATLALIVTIAGLLCRWMLRLMGPEDHALDYEPQPVRRARVKPVAQPARVSPPRHALPRSG
jgi:hypothetical protein